MYLYFVSRKTELINLASWFKKIFFKRGGGVLHALSINRNFLICRNLFSKSSFIQIIFNSIILLHCYDFDTYLIHME